MSLQDLRNDYLCGKLNKADYIARAYDIHQHLFDYASRLPATRIDRIEIRDGAVLMHSRDEDIIMECPPADRRIPPLEILNFGEYEQEEFAMISRLIGGRDVVFDIGANIGWFSILYAKRFPGARIYSFEPLPPTYAALERNFRHNALANMKIHNFAFGKEEGEKTFYYTTGLSAASSGVSKPEFPDSVECRCQMRTLDGFTRETGIYPDVIKCDVEGAELFVFEGARELLRQKPPVVLCEMLRKWATSFRYHPDEIIALFRSCGYGCYAIAGDKLAAFAKMTEETTETNFIFLHEGKHQALLSSLS